MKKVMLILLIFQFFAGTSCSDNSVIYPFDTEVKKFFEAPENKDYIRPEALEYEMHYYKNESGVITSEYGIHTLFSDDKYTLGIIRRQIYADINADIYEYSPYIDFPNYGFYDLFESYKFLNNEMNENMFDIIEGYPKYSINSYFYYNPYEDKTISNFMIKEITEDKMTFTFFITEGYYSMDRYNLISSVISTEFYEKMKGKIEAAGYDTEYLRVFKEIEKVELLKDEHYSNKYDFSVMPDKVYSTDFPFTRYSLFLEKYLYALGYTNKDMRLEQNKLGFRGDKFEGIIIDITVDISSEEPEISYKVLVKTP